MPKKTAKSKATRRPNPQQRNNVIRNGTISVCARSNQRGWFRTSSGTSPLPSSRYPGRPNLGRSSRPPYPFPTLIDCPPGNRAALAWSARRALNRWLSNACARCSSRWSDARRSSSRCGPGRTGRGSPVHVRIGRTRDWTDRTTRTHLPHRARQPRARLRHLAKEASAHPTSRHRRLQHRRPRPKLSSPYEAPPLKHRKPMPRRPPNHLPPSEPPCKPDMRRKHPPNAHALPLRCPPNAP